MLFRSTPLEKETVLPGFSRQPDSATLNSEPVTNPKGLNGQTSRTTDTNWSKHLNKMNMVVGNSATDFVDHSATTGMRVDVPSFESNAVLGKSLKQAVDHQESKVL